MDAYIKRAILMLNIAGAHCDVFASDEISNYDSTECDGSCIRMDCDASVHELETLQEQLAELVAAARELVYAQERTMLPVSKERLRNALKPFTASTEASADQSPQVGTECLPLVNSITGDGS